MCKIYLATPYSHSDPAVRQERFERVTMAAVMLINMGYAVISPITHNHSIIQTGRVPGLWDYWGKYDSLHLAASDLLVVLRLSGWEQSVGVAAEIAIAKERGMPVYYLDDALVAAWEKDGRLPEVLAHFTSG